MTIKKIVFSNLTNAGSGFTALGGIRFYNENGSLISSGSRIKHDYNYGESTNFIVTCTNTYWDSPGYHKIFNAFDTSKPQTGNYAGHFYWMSSYDNQELSITFKENINKISKMTFNPYPDHTYDNRRLTVPFILSFYDENDVLVMKKEIVPHSKRNTVQTITFNSHSHRKTFIQNNNQYYKYNVEEESWEPIGINVESKTWVDMGMLSYELGRLNKKRLEDLSNLNNTKLKVKSAKFN